MYSYIYILLLLGGCNRYIYFLTWNTKIVTISISLCKEKMAMFNQRKDIDEYEYIFYSYYMRSKS